jgi:hypothetical protein
MFGNETDSDFLDLAPKRGFMIIGTGLAAVSL